MFIVTTIQNLSKLLRSEMRPRNTLRSYGALKRKQLGCLQTFHPYGINLSTELCQEKEIRPLLHREFTEIQGRARLGMLPRLGSPSGVAFWGRFWGRLDHALCGLL